MSVTEKQRKMITTFIITSMPKVINGQHAEVIKELQDLGICKNPNTAHLAYLEIYPDVMKEYRETFASTLKGSKITLDGSLRKDITERKGSPTFSSIVRQRLNEALDKLEESDGVTLREVIGEAYDDLFQYKTELRASQNGKGFHKHGNEKTEFTYVRTAVRIEIKRALPSLATARNLTPILPSEAFALTRSRTWNKKS